MSSHKRMLLLAIVIFAAVPRASGQETKPGEPLRGKLAAWCEATLRGPRQSNEFAAIAGNADYELQNARNVTVVVDGALTLSGNHAYALTWAGELHRFDLTRAQAKAAGLLQGRAILAGRDRLETDVRIGPPAVTLEKLQIDGGLAVSGARKVTGYVVCKPVAKPFAGELLLRVAWRLTGRGRTIELVDGVPPDRILRFDIGPINEPDLDVSFGPTPLLVDLLTPSPDGRGYVVSNTLSTMLDVRPDLDAFARLRIDLWSRASDVLGTIQDEESAAAALHDYKRLEMRLEAAREAIATLRPTAEEEADVAARYGPQSDALGKRLEDQLARLRRADYAGPAFFDEVTKAVRQK